MEFYTQKKKPLTIPIMPLIDIFAILLIYFIVSTNFKKPRPILTIDLPTVLDIPSETITQERSVLSVSTDGRITLDQTEVPEGLLVEWLGVFLEKNPGAQLELKADEGVTLKQLFAIWDALTRAGIKIKDVPARIRVPSELIEEPPAE
jgi:biopolymer transport protein ExbD